jgi:hypothetical protein
VQPDSAKIGPSVANAAVLGFSNAPIQKLRLQHTRNPTCLPLFLAAARCWSEFDGRYRYFLPPKMMILCPAFLEVRAFSAFNKLINSSRAHSLFSNSHL